jgi:hypothetical protein
MLNLRIDPWDPGYGSSVETDEPAETTTDVRLDVEGDRWIAIAGTPVPDDFCCAFIDGIRRVECRLFAERQGVDMPALAGAWAVGVAWGTRPPRIEPVQVGRELIVGGGLDPEDMTVEAGGLALHYTGSSITDASTAAPLMHLQYKMREAEARLAASLFTEGGADLIVLDGPLHYVAPNGPMIGFIKRQSRAYLPPDRGTLLQTLAPGERTPLFGLGLSEHGRERYSWYMRLARGRDIDGFMTGIVRCEVSAQVGAEAAAVLASRVAGALPRYASERWHDPRAPQNLYPVGQLETLLRHRLGEQKLVRRAIERRLWRMSHA